MKNKPFFILFLIYVVITFADIITALFILPGESNPIYLLTGSIIFVMILKIVWIVPIYIIYRFGKFPSEFFYFMILLILSLAILLFGLGTYSNIYGMLNPHLVEQASHISTEEKIKSYSWLVGLVYVLPMIVSLITFQIYNKSKKYVEFKKK